MGVHNVSFESLHVGKVQLRSSQSGFRLPTGAMALVTKCLMPALPCGWRHWGSLHGFILPEGVLTIDSEHPDIVVSLINSDDIRSNLHGHTQPCSSGMAKAHASHRGTL